ncbi:MAG: serine hydrolase [Desulfobacterales bacterium]|nr:serine hydrolase [Desulfobacterales bacterium]
MNSLKSADALMRRGVSENVFPGGVLLVSSGDALAFFEAYGEADIFSGREATRETIFDLASLTKPLATTLAVLLLVQRSRVTLDQTLGELVPGFRESGKAGITLQNLLCHNSGLPDYLPYYKRLREMDRRSRGDALKKYILAQPLVHGVGEKTVYSDLGFMALRMVVEEATGEGLAGFLEREVYGPLGLDNLFFVDLHRPTPDKLFAATELCPWRNQLMVGCVHDDNAYVMGGVDGHAGLFGAARDVHLLLSELLATFLGRSEKKLFQKQWVRFFLRRRKDSDRALGFDAPSREGSSAGRHFHETSVGHLGFTGTSFWMDPVRRLIVILLTNRVHPSRDNNKIREFRPKLHDAVVESLTGS